MTEDFLPNLFETVHWKELNTEEKVQFKQAFLANTEMDSEASEQYGEIMNKEGYDYDKESMIYREIMSLKGSMNESNIYL